MHAEVRSLLDHAIKEIEWRAPDYLARFPLLFATSDQYFDRLCSSCPAVGETAASFAIKFDEGLDYVRHCGARVVKARNVDDPVAGMLADTIADATRIDGLASPCLSNREFRAQFEQSYQESRLQDGTRYFVKRDGETPLLLIPALGIPLHVWSRFLLDDSHGFRIMVVETRSCDLFIGGMTETSSVKADCHEIAGVISSQHFTGINVLAWCNGAKIALELAAEAGAAVRSLTFVSPSLSGPRDAPSVQSKYESGLRQILAAISRKPDIAPFIARGFEQLTQPADLNELSGQPNARAQALFNMPSRDHAPALKGPFASIDSLRKYAARGMDDYDYPTERRLKDLQVPSLLITGDNDQVVNNGLVTATMSRCRPPITHATIRGAGHYTFDLQYPYFKAVLKEFVERFAPTSRVRVEIDRLNSRTS
jgi:pimeloyl-ACP methyl ester carboxylesterase